MFRIKKDPYLFEAKQGTPVKGGGCQLYGGGKSQPTQMQRLRKMQQQEELGLDVRENSRRGARRKPLLS